ISGKPVSSETSLTCSPAAAIALAVPPVETSSTPCPASALANSIRPVLSETDNRARVTRRVVSVMGKVLCQGILMPRRAAIIPALPDGAPSKVASCAEAGWLAAFAGAHNGGGWLSPQQI